MSEEVLVERTQAVLSLRLNRLDKLNALTPAMYASLADALEMLERDASLRVLLLSGGPECFTSGNDITDFLERRGGLADSPVLRFMKALMECSKPVVAAVAGPAIGIGTTLLLHCDQVFVSRDARLKMPFVNLGLCPEFGSSFLLPRLLGPVKAASLLLCGEAFSGEQAAAWGIANEALADGPAAIARAQAACQALQKLPPAALLHSKRLLKAPYIEQLRRVVEEEGRLFSSRLQSPEAEEALSAFLEHRSADFSRFM